MPLIAVPLEAAPANASPRQRRAAVVFGLLALGALGALLVTQPVAGDESQRLTTDTADEKLSHHHAPSPPPFPFATSAFVFDGTASRRCIEMAISGCPPDHSAVVESFGPWKKCCPTPTPPGTCYHSDRCFADCADGFERVASSFWEPITCDDLCCTAGQPGPFWYDRCWAECPDGFESILKAPLCWDLCVPIGQFYEPWELSSVPFSDKGVSQAGHHMLGGGMMATAVGR